MNEISDVVIRGEVYNADDHIESISNVVVTSEVAIIDTSIVNISAGVVVSEAVEGKNLIMYI